MDIVPLPAGDEGRIQVTTVVEQDIERIGSDDDGEFNRIGRLGRTVRTVSQNSH